MTSPSASYGGALSTLAMHAPAQEIRAIEWLVDQFSAAWNQHNPARMASYWAEDGDLINPMGRLARGRDQVERLLREEHAGMMKDSVQQISIASVRFPADDVAVADGDCAVKGMHGADGKEMPVFRPHIFLLMSKREGSWKILSARPYGLVPTPEAK